jgi:hypothetical protein
MPFVLIRGSYHVKGFAPDGDSVRFRPDDPDAWDRVPGWRRPRPNGRGMAQLRIEAIDALETHFQAGGAVGLVHQPAGPATAARDRLLELLGIGDVVLAPDGSTIADARDGTPGFILTRAVDVNHRPIAFAYAGEPPVVADEDAVWLDVPLLRESVNHRLVAEGLVFPTYYTGLFHDLRSTFTAAADQARAAGLGVWPQDRTEAGATVTSLASITDEQVLLPKLFRRLASFIAANGGRVDLAGFEPWLEIANERVFDLDRGQETGFDDLVEVAGDTVRLTVPVTRIVFVPK